MDLDVLPQGQLSARVSAGSCIAYWSPGKTPSSPMLNLYSLDTVRVEALFGVERRE